MRGFGTGGTAIAVMLYPTKVAEAQGNFLPQTPGTLECVCFFPSGACSHGEKHLVHFPDMIVLFPEHT